MLAGYTYRLIRMESRTSVMVDAAMALARWVPSSRASLTKSGCSS